MSKKEIKYTDENIECHHCGNAPIMQFIGSVEDMKIEGGIDCAPYEYGDTYETLKCPVCKEVTIRKYFWHDGYMEPGEHTVEYIHLYPSPKKIPVGLPVHISRALAAAEKVRNIDANAFGVLVRRLLELVCIDRSASGKDLKEQLKDLSSKGEIPANLVDVSHKLRILGNIGAHPSIGELSQADLPILSSLSNAVLEYVYSAPYYAQMAENAVSQKRSKLDDSKELKG
ncbi:DUF4145 domain-containing protein [bacterium]|nr:DUF4145 domain-containing protein [bacterium]